jgi:DNA-binding transcriptional regulator YhcF (GntR family)
MKPRGKIPHLTREEARAYQFIMEFYIEYGHMPSTNLLAIEFGVNRSVTTRRMQSLMGKGYLRPIDPPMGYTFTRKQNHVLRDTRRCAIARRDAMKLRQMEVHA